MPPEVLLTRGGFQVPEMPLLETDGSTGGVVPSQKGGMGSKVGVILGSIAISCEMGSAHCPGLGLKV